MRGAFPWCAGDAILAAHGFTPARDRTWVRDLGLRRDLFQLADVKGARTSARWGIDLAFVPTPRGAGLRWKRKAADVVIDLVFDPIDESGDAPAWCSFMPLEEAEIERVVRACAPLAARDTAAFADLASVVEELERRVRQVWKRFGPNQYVQTDLLWGLSLHGLGRAEEADEHLDRFCLDRGIARHDRLLLRAVAEAAAVGRGPLCARG